MIEVREAPAYHGELVSDDHVKTEAVLAEVPPKTFNESPIHKKRAVNPVPEMGENGNGLTRTVMDFAAKHVLPRGVPTTKNEKLPCSLIGTLNVESVRVPVIAALDHK